MREDPFNVLETLVARDLISNWLPAVARITQSLYKNGQYRKEKWIGRDGDGRA